MQAANAPTPGTTRPSASIAAVPSRRSASTVGAGALEGAHGRAEVARAVVEDDDARAPLRARPWCEGTPVSRGSSATASRKRPGERLELRLDEVVRVAAGQHPHVQRDLGVEGERLEDVPGQRAEVRVAADRRRTPGRPARRCARSRAGRRRRRRACTSASSSGTGRRRSGGCRPCRRAPRAAPGRARSRCPRRCGGRRCGCRPRSARSGRPARAGRTRSSMWS